MLESKVAFVKGYCEKIGNKSVDIHMGCQLLVLDFGNLPGKYYEFKVLDSERGRVLYVDFLNAESITECFRVVHRTERAT